MPVVEGTPRSPEMRKAMEEALEEYSVLDLPGFAEAYADLKPTNPKDALGSGRVPMSLFPDTVVALGSMAFLEGALKYGRYNWRDAGVRASIYADAAKRHMADWWNGEDVDPDSGLHHLVKALACIAILIDADVCDKFVDDRPTGAPFAELIKELTPMVAELKERLG